MKTTKAYTLTAGIAGTLFALTACSMGTAPSDPSVENATAGAEQAALEAEEITIGLSTQDAENQYWIELADEFRKVAEAQGVEVNFAAEYNAAKQSEIVRNFLQQGVDAIVVSPVDPTVMEPVFEEAKKAGVYVVNGHFPTDPQYYDLYLDTGAYESGQLAGTWAANYINDELGGSAQVGVLTLPENPTLKARMQGMMDALKANAPGAEIVAEQRAQSREDAVRVTENILTANPNTNVWLGWSDSVILGSVAALEGRQENLDEHVLVGVDATCDALKAVQEGKMSATVDNPPRPFARIAFDAVFEVLTQETSPYDNMVHIVTRLDMVDESNVDQFISRC